MQVLPDSVEGGVSISVENNVPSGGVTLSKVTVSRGGNPVWSQLLSSPVLAAAGSRYALIFHDYVLVVNIGLC